MTEEARKIIRDGDSYYEVNLITGEITEVPASLVQGGGTKRRTITTTLTTKE